MYKNLSPEALGFSGGQSEVIELALSFGFRGIDLDLLEFGDQVARQGLPSARRFIDSAKLKLGGFRMPIDWEITDETFRADLAKMLPAATAAAEMGCERAWTLVAPASDLLPFHANYEFHRSRLAEVAKMLEPLGIRLGVGLQSAAELRVGKAFEFIHTADALQMLTGTVQAPNVGIALDLWELHVAGGILEQVLEKLKPAQLITVSLADIPADVDLAQATAADRLLPAGEEGVINSAAALATLAEWGYTGPVTPAPHASRLPGTRKDVMVKATGAALDLVWKAAGLNANGKLSTATA